MCYNKLIRFLIHRKELFMAVCYKKLWKLLIDKNMNKTELRMASGITTTALAELGRDENVNTEILAKICKTLDCKIEDIMEMVPDVTE
jgi:DNA-binding Xre family transcriptional regulator